MPLVKQHNAFVSGYRSGGVTAGSEGIVHHDWELFIEIHQTSPFGDHRIVLTEELALKVYAELQQQLEHNSTLPLPQRAR